MFQLRHSQTQTMIHWYSGSMVAQAVLLCLPCSQNMVLISLMTASTNLRRIHILGTREPMYSIQRALLVLDSHTHLMSTTTTRTICLNQRMPLSRYKNFTRDSQNTQTMTSTSQVRAMVVFTCPTSLGRSISQTRSLSSTLTVESPNSSSRASWQETEPLTGILTFHLLTLLWFSTLISSLDSCFKHSRKTTAYFISMMPSHHITVPSATRHGMLLMP